jgi:hypothetical protein
VEHVAEGQENHRRTPQGCSRRGDRIKKNFTISELGNQTDHRLRKDSLPLT